MPASFEDSPSDDLRPPPPQPEIRDENVGTILKIGGTVCVAICLCGMGAILLILPMMFAPFGFSLYMGFTALIGLFFTVIGCYAGYYGWKAADDGSKW
jgi:hypothetical protein